MYNHRKNSPVTQKNFTGRKMSCPILFIFSNSLNALFFIQFKLTASTLPDRCSDRHRINHKKTMITQFKLIFKDTHCE